MLYTLELTLSPSISILVPCIVPVPSLFILSITEWILSLPPSILASPAILSLFIEPSVIPSRYTPFSSYKIVLPSAPRTLRPYTVPSSFTSPRDTLSNCEVPIPSNTCNLLPLSFKLPLAPAIVILDVSISPASSLSALTLLICALPIAPFAIIVLPATIVPACI